MTENLGACEFEDSTDCIWNAQEQGNGIGESFIDIDGSVHYTEDPTVYDDVWVDEGESFPYQYVNAQGDGEDYMVITWAGEPTSIVDNDPAPLEPEDGFFVDCGTQMLHYWYVGSEGQDIVDEGTPASGSELFNYGCTDEAGNVIWPIPVEVGEIIVSPEVHEVPEPVEELITETPVMVDSVPEELAETGTIEVVSGALLGIALVITGVVTMMKGRRVA